MDDNDATYAEMEAFQVGTEMNETIARVNVRLGFEGEKVLEFSLRFWFRSFLTTILDVIPIIRLNFQRPRTWFSLTLW